MTKSPDGGKQKQSHHIPTSEKSHTSATQYKSKPQTPTNVRKTKPFCLWIKNSIERKDVELNYPHFWKREELLGFSNWITPSNGTSFPLRKTVSSLANGAELEEEVAVVVELESTPSALACVICKGFSWVVLLLNLGLPLEKSVGFAFTNLIDDEREHLADNAPPGAWLTSIILSPNSSIAPPCLPHKHYIYTSPQNPKLSQILLFWAIPFLFRFFLAYFLVQFFFFLK